MHLEVPESLEEDRAELEEERQKYMEILDYQGGWRVSIFMGNKWQREAGWELGKSKEEDRHSRRAEGKKRQRRWGGSSIPGREARPGKGILREVSKHQETLSLPSLWLALETQRAT